VDELIGIGKICSLQYSMLMNLIYAYDHLQNFRLSSFENFYSHLASACDLAEDFCWKSYLLILESRGKESEILQSLKKEDFLKLASDWYDKNYSKVYQNYLTKGKSPPIRLPSRRDILDEYFQGAEDWKNYKNFARVVREYRNVIVHNIKLANLAIGGFILVPKKEKVQNYRSWSKVFSVVEDAPKLKDDFIDMKEQMILDMGFLQIMFNNLWSKTIAEMRELFFVEKNHILVEKYDIEFIP